MSLLSSFPGSLVKPVKLKLVSNWVLLILGCGLGVVTAYLIVAGSWQLALGLLLVPPAVILLHRYPFLAILVWLILDPFLMTTQTETGRRVYWLIHRALPPAAVGIMVLSSSLRINRRKLPRVVWPELAMAGYVVASLLSIILLNDDPLATTYLFYDRVFTPMCLYLLVRLSAPDERDLQRLMPIVFFLGVSQSIIGILSWFAPQVLPSAWLGKAGERTIGSLVNPSTFTSTLMFSGLLLLHAAWNRKPGLVRTLYISAFVLAAFCVFLSFSRGSWLGGLLVLLLPAMGLIYLYPKVILRLSMVILPAVMILGGGLLADQLGWARERLYSERAEESALSRLPVYYAAYRMFEARPVVGWGYGNFDRYDRQFQGRVADLVNPAKDHASHNLYLTLIAEQGLIGFSLFLTPLIWWLILTLKILPRMPGGGLWSGKLLILFWLIMLNYVVVNNFHNNRVVFGLGLWWVSLGFIAHMVHSRLVTAGSGVLARARRPISWPGAREPQPNGNLGHVDLFRGSN